MIHASHQPAYHPRFLNEETETYRVYVTCWVNRYWNQLIIWTHRVWFYDPCYDLPSSHKMEIVTDTEGLRKQRSAPQDTLGFIRDYRAPANNLLGDKSCTNPFSVFPWDPCWIHARPRGVSSAPWRVEGAAPPRAPGTRTASTRGGRKEGLLWSSSVTRTFIK